MTKEDRAKKADAEYKRAIAYFEKWQGKPFPKNRKLATSGMKKAVIEVYRLVLKMQALRKKYGNFPIGERPIALSPRGRIARATTGGRK